MKTTCACVYCSIEILFLNDTLLLILLTVSCSW